MVACCGSAEPLLLLDEKGLRTWEEDQVEEEVDPLEEEADPPEEEAGEVHWLLKEEVAGMAVHM